MRYKSGPSFHKVSCKCFIHSKEGREKSNILLKKRYEKGYVPWNKGLHIRLNPKGEFKKGHKPWHAGLKGIFEGKESPHWLGDKVGYAGIHDWVIKNLGKPDICENCSKSELRGKQIQWANKSGEYKRDLSDWIRLCVKCHRKYDKNIPTARKIFIEKNNHYSQRKDVISY